VKLTLKLLLPPQETWAFEDGEATLAKHWLDHFDSLKLVEGSPQPALVADEDGTDVGAWDLDGIREIANSVDFARPSDSPVWIEIRNALLIAASAG
jgi:hypothetical protein